MIEARQPSVALHHSLDKLERERGSRRNGFTVSAVILLVYCKICNILSHFMWRAILCLYSFTVTLSCRVLFLGEGHKSYCWLWWNNFDNEIIFVVNSNLNDFDFRVDFESSLGSKVLYRHLYDPQTFEANTAAKPIGVDRVLINVSEGFVDKIPAGGVAVYTTSKK